MSVRTALYEQLDSLNLSSKAGIDDDTPLLESGILDSLSLMRLAQWIESEIGGGLDVTSFNVMEEWRTPRTIVAFVETRKASGK